MHRGASGLRMGRDRYGFAADGGLFTLATAMSTLTGGLFLDVYDPRVVAFAAGVSAKAKLGSSGQHAASSSTGFLMLETLLLHNNEIGDRGACAACS